MTYHIQSTSEPLSGEQPPPSDEHSTPRLKVAVLMRADDTLPPAFDRLRHEAEVRLATETTLGDALKGADVLVVWDFVSPVLESVFHHADTLRWIHIASAGVDAHMFPALRASDVMVTNARDIFNRPIAEFTLSYMLTFSKDMLRSRALQSRHHWLHRETTDLRGSTALIVGTGAIGREIARVLRGVGVEVRGAGSTARTGDPEFGVVIDSAQLSQHVSDIDWLINIAPLTPRTHHLITSEVFTAMPTSAYFLNLGRGASVVTDDLVWALENAEIAGAALDVVDPEPLPENHPLWDYENVIITPHMSGDTHGWQNRLAQQFMNNWERYRRGAPLENLVDVYTGYSARRT